MRACDDESVEEATIKLIQLYREQPCLWQTDHPDFNSKRVRLSALKSIVHDMHIQDLDVAACKGKIKQLRSLYRHELKKIYQSAIRRTPNESLYKPALAWFPIIDRFLRNYVHQTINIEVDNMPGQSGTDSECQTFNNVESVNQTISDEEKIDNDDSKEIFTPDVVIKQEDIGDEINDVNHSYVNDDGDNREDKIRPRERVKFYERKRHSNMYEIEHMKRIKRKRTALPETEFDIYCESVALQLNNMPLKNALHLQLNIQSVVTEERLKCVNNAHS